MSKGEFWRKCGQTVGSQMSVVRLHGHDAAVVADCLWKVPTKQLTLHGGHKATLTTQNHNFGWPNSAVLCLPESSRCLPLLLLTSMSLSHTTPLSKWSREGSFKPWQVLQIPFSSQAAPWTANRAHSSPALAVWPCGYWLTVSPPAPLPTAKTQGGRRRVEKSASFTQ